MKSPVAKRSFNLRVHKTSVSLEEAFWSGLKEIADGRGMTLSELVNEVDRQRVHKSLSSAIRLSGFAQYWKNGAGNGSTGDAKD